MVHRVGCIFFAFFWLFSMLAFAILLPELGPGGWVFGGTISVITLAWVSVKGSSRPRSGDF